ncbi:hypothetical protein GF336_06450 [Candidatus Woesearchaeota archaeon]|nr:hypothetical protein [Candidatus Woesearchaeota archaeon]
MKSNITLPEQHSVEKDLALLYGVMLGDGCLSKSGRAHFIVVSGHMNDDINFFKKILPIFTKIRKKECKISYKKNENTIEINFSDKKLFDIFREIGMPIGKKGISLKISERFDKKLYNRLIKGYFATDGCLVITNNNGILYPRIEFSSISKKILTQTKSYLESIGMKGGLYISHQPNGKWNTLYRTQFNGKNNLEIFRSKIRFINPKHEEKYKNWKKSG